MRPYPALLQMMSNQVGFGGFGDAIAAVALIGWALTRVHVDWDLPTVAIGLVLLVSASAIRIAITVASNAVSFWLPPSPMPMFATALFQVGELSRYPLSVYGFGLRVLVTAVVPFAFTAFFPAAWLLHKDGYATVGLATPAVAVVSCLAAYGLFQLGVRRYESAGN